MPWSGLTLGEFPRHDGCRSVLLSWLDSGRLGLLSIAPWESLVRMRVSNPEPQNVVTPVSQL